MSPLAEESILFAFAQVAVLFAGFGGVSIVLGRLRTPIELARLRNVIITAFFILLMSLFPVLLNQYGIKPETTWRVGTGVIASIMIAFYAISGDLKLFKDTNRLDQSGMIGDGILIMLLIVGTLGVELGLAAKIYLTALFWHLLSACVMFIMVFEPVWRDPDLGGN